MPNGILRALKAKSAKTSEEHGLGNSCGTSNHNVSPPPRSPQRSPSYRLRGMSNSFETFGGTRENNNGCSEVGSEQPRRKHFPPRWFLKHRNCPSDSSSLEEVLGEDACLLEPSDHIRCLSPSPNASSPTQDHTETLSTIHKECQMASKFALENATGSRNSAARIVVAGLKFPMDFALHVAKGFHNAPKIYGDNTVRPFHKIEGLRTGIESSGRVSSAHVGCMAALIQVGVRFWCLRRCYRCTYSANQRRKGRRVCWVCGRCRKGCRRACSEASRRYVFSSWAKFKMRLTA